MGNSKMVGSSNGCSHAESHETEVPFPHLTKFTFQGTRRNFSMTVL